MKREDLEEKKKEDLIYMIIGMEEDIKIKEDQIHNLEKQISKSKFEDYIYDDYINTKELLANEYEKNRLNDARIRDLDELLDRYKNIVDRLGIRDTY